MTGHEAAAPRRSPACAHGTRARPSAGRPVGEPCSGYSGAFGAWRACSPGRDTWRGPGRCSGSARRRGCGGLRQGGFRLLVALLVLLPSGPDELHRRGLRGAAAVGADAGGTLRLVLAMGSAEELLHHYQRERGACSRADHQQTRRPGGPSASLRWCRSLAAALVALFGGGIVGGICRRPSPAPWTHARLLLALDYAMMAGPRCSTAILSACFAAPAGGSWRIFRLAHRRARGHSSSTRRSAATDVS